MNIELKQAAQDAAEAIDWLLKNIRLDAPQLSGKAMGNAEKCATALRTALAQQPATATACGIPGMAKTTCPYCEQGFAFEHEQPATGEPVDFPAGAIVNGRTLMDRIEAYPFESEGGDLRMCSDWHELRRCFEHLADYVSPHPAPSVLKDDQIAALVNKVRDIARMFNDHQSLRERIAIELVPVLKVTQEVKSDAERWRYAIADGGNQSMNFIDSFGDWNGDGDFVEVFDAAMLADNTPTHQPKEPS